MGFAASGVGLDQEARLGLGSRYVDPLLDLGQRPTRLGQTPGFEPTRFQLAEIDFGLPGRTSEAFLEFAVEPQLDLDDGGISHDQLDGM